VRLSGLASATGRGKGMFCPGPDKSTIVDHTGDRKPQFVGALRGPADFESNLGNFAGRFRTQRSQLGAVSLKIEELKPAGLL